MAPEGVRARPYNRLHLRDNSPLTRLQREMLATVVNGAIGGAPDSACTRRPCAASRVMSTWEATALTKYFNFTGRIEAASGLPQDRPPDDSRMPEMRSG